MIHAASVALASIGHASAVATARTRDSGGGRRCCPAQRPWRHDARWHRWRRTVEQPLPRRARETVPALSIGRLERTALTSTSSNGTIPRGARAPRRSARPGDRRAAAKPPRGHAHGGQRGRAPTVNARTAERRIAGASHAASRGGKKSAGRQTRHPAPTRAGRLRRAIGADTRGATSGAGRGLSRAPYHGLCNQCSNHEDQAILPITLAALRSAAPAARPRCDARRPDRCICLRNPPGHTVQRALTDIDVDGKRTAVRPPIDARDLRRLGRALGRR